MFVHLLYLYLPEEHTASEALSTTVSGFLDYSVSSMQNECGTT